MAQAIDSVLAQSYQNLELILVNDGSADASESIMLSYRDRDDRIVYLKNEVNATLPAALNRGFAHARGAYFTWTSDDNLYHPDAIAEMAAYLEAHPDVGMVSCDCRKIDENGRPLSVWRVGGIDRLIYENVIGACFLYRAEAAAAIGAYRTDLFLLEDYDYWLRMSQRFRIDFLHKVLYDYRRLSAAALSRRCFCF